MVNSPQLLEASQGKPFPAHGAWKPTAFLLLFLACFASARAATARAAFDRLFIELGESVEFSVVVEGAQNAEPPKIPPLQNLAKGFYKGPSQSISTINGNTTYQVTYRYSLQPGAAGDFNVPSLSVMADGSSLVTPPLRCRVLPFTPQTNKMWLKILTERDTYSLGEVIPFEIQLYSGYDLKGGSPPTLSLDGFVTSHEQKQSSAQTSRPGENQPFSVTTFRMTATPTKGGDLTLGPASMEIIIAVPTGRPTRGFFDEIFGGGYEQRRITLNAPGKILHVAQPPLAGRPPNYSGAVGRFAAEATVSRTNLMAGDPITLKITVTGQGAFDTLPTPQLAEQPGLKTYAGTNSFQSGDSLGLIGSKTFEQAVIVESSEVTALRFEPFSFFDPQARRYETVSLAPIAIHVSAAPASPPPPGAASANASASPTNTDVIAAKDGLRPLKVGMGDPAPPDGGFAASAWFALAATAPLLLYAGWAAGTRAVTARAAKSRTASDPQIRIDALRNEMKKAAESGDAASFYAAVNQLLQAEIASLLHIPPSSVNGEIVEPQLLPLGLPVEDGTRLRKLFEGVEAARFGGGATPGALRSTMEEAESTLAALKQLHWRN